MCLRHNRLKPLVCMPVPRAGPGRMSGRIRTARHVADVGGGGMYEAEGGVVPKLPSAALSDLSAASFAAGGGEMLRHTEFQTCCMCVRIEITQALSQALDCYLGPELVS